MQRFYLARYRVTPNGRLKRRGDSDVAPSTQTTPRAFCPQQQRRNRVGLEVMLGGLVTNTMPTNESR